MNNYELLYIINNELEEQGKKGLIEKFNGIIANKGGKVVRLDEWGRRKLAYPIDYKTEGYYVLEYFEGPSDLPHELERNFRISDNILRYMIVRIEDDMPAAQPQSQDAAQKTETTPSVQSIAVEATPATEADSELEESATEETPVAEQEAQVTDNE